MSDESSIQSWSTEEIPQGMRLDYWMSTLRTALWPVTQWSGVARNFGVELHEAPLGCLAALNLRISAHDSHRSRRDVNRSREACYLLIANYKSVWGSTHHGHAERLRPADLVLWADDELDTYIPDGLDGAVLRMPAEWLRSWIPDPHAIAGRRIAYDSTWGRVLSPMVSQLTPDYVSNAPLPHGVLVDQVGAVLALLAGDAEASSRREVVRRARDTIRDRCSEPHLAAADVAAALRVAPRDLHHALAAAGTTFAAELMARRVDRALELLGARALHALTLAEIGERCGFPSPAHFGRAIRRRTGLSAEQLRGLDRTRQ